MPRPVATTPSKEVGRTGNGSVAPVHPAGPRNAPRRRAWSAGPLPGFLPAFSYTTLYLGVVVLIPLGALVLRTAHAGWPHIWQTISSPRALAAYRISFGGALLAAVVNAVFGLLLAWVLTRYRVPGKRFLDALVDLPLALPTAVAGIALTAIYSANGWIGRWLEPRGVQVAFAPLGVIVAMIFVGLPFVTRTVQPVLVSLDLQREEAAATLGASRWTTFRRVILPAVGPALLTGFALAFARAVGEYGSIVFISGNMPLRTEIAPLLIVTQLEQYDYTAATALALVMLIGSFGLLLTINLLQAWSHAKVRRG